MIVFLLIFLIPSVNMMKILTFKSNLNSNMSFATIQNPVTSIIPESFIFCASFKETTTVSSISFFTIYGEDGKPWLTLSHWDYKEGITIFTKVRHAWINMGYLERFQINFWIHTCVQVNTTSGDLALSINGKQSMPIKEKYLTGY